MPEPALSPAPLPPAPPPPPPQPGRQLARLQAGLLCAWACVLLVWLGYAAHQAQAERPVGFPLAMAALTVSGHALWLGFAMAMSQWHNRREPTPRPSLGLVVRAWAGEVRHAVAVFGWRQPFFAHAQPDHLPPQAWGRPGVLLVHGYVCNRGFWAPWMIQLRRQGVPVVAITLEPVVGSIDDYAGAIEAAVRQLEAATGQPPLLVGHSMGGLAIRAWRRAFGVPAARVRGVITLGTPHQGTWLAHFAPTRNGQQMVPGSHWLRDLAASEPADWCARLTCWYSHCDCIVFPAHLACLPGAVAQHHPGVAHVALAFEPAVFQAVCRRLG